MRELQALLETHTHELVLMPGVAEWGVGVEGADPVVHVFVSAQPDETTVGRLDEMFDGQFLVIELDQPADAS